MSREAAAAKAGRPELWRLVIDWMRRFPSTSAPRGQDRARVRWLLWELYLLGECPTTQEVREAGGLKGHPTGWSRAVAGLWAERLRAPSRNISGSGWRYPFFLPAELVREHDLEPIEARLERQVIQTACDYSAAISKRDDESTIRALDQLVYLQARALRVWGQTQLALRKGHDVLGGLWLPRTRPLLVSPLPRPGE